MHQLHTYSRYPVTIARGEGARLQDDQGRWYLDACAGIAVNAVGHGHPAVLEAVHAQADRLLHCSNLYAVDVQERLAEALVALYGGMRPFFCNSGAEAVEAALKLARKHHWRRGDPRPEVLTLTGAFHGRTLAAVAMTPKASVREGFGPLPAGFRSLPAAAIPAAVSERTAAVFVEPVQGEGGCRAVENLAAIRAACDDVGALLIYDEIQCGLGRCGQWTFAPEPDARCLAKALGGGLPLGATLASPAVADALQPGDHGSTFGGNPLACAAARARLLVIEVEGLGARAAALGARLRSALEAAGAEVSGQGLMLAARADAPAAAIIEGMRARGVLTCPAGAAVRFLSPLSVTAAEIDAMAAAYAGALGRGLSPSGSNHTCARTVDARLQHQPGLLVAPPRRRGRRP